MLAFYLGEKFNDFLRRWERNFARKRSRDNSFHEKKNRNDSNAWSFLTFFIREMSSKVKQSIFRMCHFCIFCMFIKHFSIEKFHLKLHNINSRLNTKFVSKFPALYFPSTRCPFNITVVIMAFWHSSNTSKITSIRNVWMKLIDIKILNSSNYFYIWINHNYAAISYKNNINLLNPPTGRRISLFITKTTPLLLIRTDFVIEHWRPSDGRCNMQLFLSFPFKCNFMKLAIN